MPAPNFDEQRAKVDALDAQVRFAKQSADLRQKLLENELQMKAKSQKAHREFGEKWVRDRVINSAYDRIDQQEAAYEEAQAAREAGEAPPPVPPNQGMIPVKAGVMNPQAGGGPDAAASIFNQVNGGGPVQSRGEDFFNLNAQDPTEGGKRVGNDFRQLPSGQITETTVRPLQTGLRAVDTINALSMLFTGGKPLMKETFTTERPDMVADIYNAKAQEAANAASALRHRETEDRLRKQEDRLARAEDRADEDQKFQREKHNLALRELEFRSQREVRRANKDLADMAFRLAGDANTIAGQFQSLSRPTIIKMDAARQVIQYKDNPSKAGDRSIRFLHATTLQPDGRLSDKDVELVNKIGSWADYATNFLSMGVEGLTEEEIRNDIIEDTRRRAQTSYDGWKHLQGQFKDRAAARGHDPNLVVIDIAPLPMTKGTKPKVDKETGARAVFEMELP
jgi:hypothetical protein